MKPLKRGAEGEAKDRGVLNSAGSIWLDKILDERLEVSPLINLHPVVPFQHKGVVWLVGFAAIVQGLNVLDAIGTISDGEHRLVLIPRRNEPLIHQSGLEVERVEVVVGWREAN